MNDRVIDCFVLFIYLFDDCIVVNDNCQEGGRPVSLEEVLGSFFGCAIPSGAASRVASRGSR